MTKVMIPSAEATRKTMVVAAALLGVCGLHGHLRAQESGPDFVRITTVRTVSATHAEVVSILRSATKLAERLRPESSTASQSTLVLSSGVDEVSFERVPSEEEVSDLTFKATKLRAQWRGSDSDPVSSIEVHLSDGYREVRVRGSDKSNVETVSKELTQGLEKHTAWMAGRAFRLAGGVALFILTATLVLLLFLKVRFEAGIVAALVVPTIVNPIIWFLPDWDDAFPAVTVMPRNPRFIDAYAAEISVIGVVATLVLGLLPFLIRRRPPRQQSPGPLAGPLHPPAGVKPEESN